MKMKLQLIVYVDSRADIFSSIREFAEYQKEEVELRIFDTLCDGTCEKAKAGLASCVNLKISYFPAQNMTPAQCYNKVLNGSDGRGWINFSRSASSFELFDVEAAAEMCDEYGVSLFSCTPVQILNGSETNCLYFRERNRVIDAEGEDIFCSNLVLDSFFFRADALDKCPAFNEDDTLECEELFILSALTEYKRYYLSEKKCHVRRATVADLYNNPAMYSRKWYTHSLDCHYTKLLAEHPDSRLLQAGLLSLVEIKFNANKNVRNKNLMDETELKKFFRSVHDFLQKVDDDLIARYRLSKGRIIPKYFSTGFLSLKYGFEDRFLAIDGNEIFLSTDSGPLAIDNINSIRFEVDAINVEEGIISFEGEISGIYWADYDRIAAFARCGEENIRAEVLGIYNHEKFFGITAWKGYMIRISIPVEKALNRSIDFHVDVYGRHITCRKIIYRKLQSRLTNDSRMSFWQFDDYILKRQLRGETDAVTVKRKSSWNVFVHEAGYLMDIRSRSIARLRLRYYKEKRKRKNRSLWITYDQLFKGGDNGEYLFRNVMDNHSDEQDIKYIAKADSQVYAELKREYGNVIPYDMNQRKERENLILNGLLADVILSTRADVGKFLGFGGMKSRYSRYLRDLFNADIVCLQHGLTMQKIAEYQNRLFDNLRYYLCASPYEIENLQKKEFGFTKEMTALTGSPRYDGLKGLPEKRIIIAPTWRRNVLEGISAKGESGKYSEAFKNTPYFRVFNGIINDSRLRDCARKTGYRIMFLMHPNMGPQKKDFKGNECVDIVSGADVSYEKVMKSSALMVTDYSGIQYDFAYMRRPLIYFHPDEIPPQYGDGAMDYETMGFGPVCRTGDELVDAVCLAMERDCDIQEKYRERIEKFFPYHDRKCSERVYEAMRKFQKEKISE